MKIETKYNVGDHVQFRYKNELYHDVIWKISKYSHTVWYTTRLRREWDIPESDILHKYVKDE